MTNLIQAIKQKDWALFNKLAQDKANLDLQDESGLTPLMHAIICKNTKIAILLINQGANLKLQDKNGMTAFKYALREDATEITEHIINKYENINFQDEQGKTLLMHAIQYIDVPTAHMLLMKNDLEINLQDQDGMTALMHAVSYSYAERFKLLLDKFKGGWLERKGEDHWQKELNDTSKQLSRIVELLLVHDTINLNLQNRDDKTALMLSLLYDNIKMARSLIVHHSIDLDLKSGTLIIAIREGHTEVAKQLIRAGADVDWQDEFGLTALMTATEKGNTDIVKQLIRAGADPNLQDECGFTALMTATYKGSIEIAQLLIDHGADLKLQDSDGLTALIIADFKGHTQIAKSILNKDPSLDQNEETELMKAIRYGEIDKLESLANLGVDLSLKDSNSMTALDRLKQIKPLLNEVSYKKIIQILTYSLKNSESAKSLLIASCIEYQDHQPDLLKTDLSNAENDQETYLLGGAANQLGS